jgi:DNA-binding transcriptional regulator YiaG
MPNVASILKSEFSRLARKELKGGLATLQKTSAAHRHEIAELKRRISDLERRLNGLSQAQSKRRLEAVDAQDVKLRFRSEGFAQHRKRLGLSAREMGMLLNASALSVYKWEAGKSKPQAKHLAAIAAIRSIGKREATRRLEELRA